MRAQPGSLFALGGGRLEKAPVGGVVHRLGHDADVVARALEATVALDREQRSPSRRRIRPCTHDHVARETPPARDRGGGVGRRRLFGPLLPALAAVLSHAVSLRTVSSASWSVVRPSRSGLRRESPARATVTAATNPSSTSVSQRRSSSAQASATAPPGSVAGGSRRQHPLATRRCRWGQESYHTGHEGQREGDRDHRQRGGAGVGDRRRRQPAPAADEPAEPDASRRAADRRCRKRSPAQRRPVQQSQTPAGQGREDARMEHDEHQRNAEQAPGSRRARSYSQKGKSSAAVSRAPPTTSTCS